MISVSKETHYYDRAGITLARYFYTEKRLESGGAE